MSALYTVNENIPEKKSLGGHWLISQKYFLLIKITKIKELNYIFMILVYMYKECLYDQDISKSTHI